MKQNEMSLVLTSASQLSIAVCPDDTSALQLNTSDNLGQMIYIDHPNVDEHIENTFGPKLFAISMMSGNVFFLSDNLTST